MVAVPAMPTNRSSKIFGRAKVVPWKIMLETAVVKKMIMVTRISMARHSALLAADGAAAPGAATEAEAAFFNGNRSR